MNPPEELNSYLKELQLVWPQQHYEKRAEEAVRENWTLADYLRRLLEGECLRRRDNRIQRRIRSAHVR